LQQVPSRGKLSKYIKRVFIARQGTIFIKVDYSAHEVRGWSLISGDKNVAGAFQKGIDLYNEYIWNPTKENWAKFKAEGDIHIINSAYFFGLKVSEVTDDIRQGVKGVTFGLIYGLKRLFCLDVH
jgi:DNA polymerase-1